MRAVQREHTQCPEPCPYTRLTKGRGGKVCSWWRARTPKGTRTHHRPPEDTAVRLAGAPLRTHSAPGGQAGPDTIDAGPWAPPPRGPSLMLPPTLRSYLLPPPARSSGPTPNARDTQLPSWWVGPGIRWWETGQKDEQVTCVILSDLLQKVIHHGNVH